MGSDRVMKEWAVTRMSRKSRISRMEVTSSAKGLSMRPESADGVDLSDDIEALSDGIVVRIGQVEVGSESMDFKQRQLWISSQKSVEVGDKT